MEVHDSLTPWSPNTRRRGSKLATPHLKEEMRDDQCLGIFDVGLEGQLQLPQRALIRAANQLPPRALRRSAPWDFHHWCRMVMSVPTEKCRTPMSRKYFA